MQQQSRQIRRYWILLVLRAARHCGFGTVASDVFHRLVFFSNSLARTVDIEPETARVLKAENGPFFPDYQWDLDRLVGMDLIDVKEIGWASGDGRYLGKFRINDNGMSFVKEVLKEFGYFMLTERAISEVVSAFSKTQGVFSNSTALCDVNYAQDTVRNGEIIDYGEWNIQNFTSEAAQYLYSVWSHGVGAMASTETYEQAIDTSQPQSQPVKEYVDEDRDYLDEPVSSTDDGHFRKTAFYLYAHYLNCQMQQQRQVA